MEDRSKNALIICIDFNRDRDFNELVMEAEALVRSAGYNIVEVLKIKRNSVDRKFMIGSGKVEELKAVCNSLEIATVVINHNLSPLQERNLEVELQLRVIDRTRLILDIFASRVKTNEGALQVELAVQTHQLSRLVRRWSHLERQRGGIGLRGGPGETQLELDRRAIADKVKKIKMRLQTAVRDRQTQRRRRAKSGICSISIVGYTNAGKSTLFNALTKANVYVENRLFATLETTSRKLFIDNDMQDNLAKKNIDDASIVNDMAYENTIVDRNREIVISDTVGFIRDLPHTLVAAFRATLEETVHAQLLLHVVDVSDPLKDRQIEDVNKVLKEIRAADIPQLIIYNKIDLLEQKIIPRVMYNSEGEPIAVYLSAGNKEGLDVLKAAILEKLKVINVISGKQELVYEPWKS